MSALPQSPERDVRIWRCLAQIVSKDFSRYNINHTHCVSKRRLEATDGQRAIVIELASGEKDLLIPDSLVGKLIETKTAVIRLKLGVPLVEGAGGDFPDLSKVWPKRAADVRRQEMHFSPKLLGSTLLAIRDLHGRSQNHAVTIHPGDDEHVPMEIVASSEEFLCSVVIMPMRTESRWRHGPTPSITAVVAP